jgi:hypothetical protein
VLEGRVVGVFETGLVVNCCFWLEGEMEGDWYDTCSYSEKSIRESRGSRQLDCEFEVDMMDEDCVEEVIVSLG